MYGKEALQIAEPLYERVFFQQMPIQVEVTQKPSVRLHGRLRSETVERFNTTADSLAAAYT